MPHINWSKRPIFVVRSILVSIVERNCVFGLGMVVATIPGIAVLRELGQLITSQTQRTFSVVPRIFFFVTNDQDACTRNTVSLTQSDF